ncbi:MAG: M56 family metallopeptidase [Clostridia bacterium]|nr:M56 family metallopeptidase [Clostridia bacterium]
MRTATVYNFLIEANIMASLAILLMIPIRKFLRPSLGSRALCFAWLLVAVRLLCPIALPNPWIDEIKTPYNRDPAAVRPIAGQVKVRLEDAVNDLFNRRLAQAPTGPIDKTMKTDAVLRGLYEVRDGFYDGRTAHTLMNLYVLGAGGVAAWFTFANVRFRKKLKKGRVEALSGEALEQYKALCAEKGVRALPVYLTDPLSSACLVGVIRPYIALPLAAEQAQAEQMLRHEICHYKAKDHLWTLLSLLCCVIHWFNPLVWIAAAMARTDRELRCDDSVTRNMDESGRRAYAETLVRAVAKHSAPGIPVLATGMSMTGKKMKLRVGGILRGGKRVRAFAFVFVLTACVLLAGAFATAEMPYARAPIPESGNKNELKDTFSITNAKITKEQAVEIAKEAWSLPALGVDAEGAEWIVERDAESFRFRPCYRVTAILPDGNRLACSVNTDGSGVSGFDNVEAIYMRDEMTGPAPAENDAYRQELKEFVYAFAETVEPGVTDHFVSWTDYGNETDGDVTYALFEAWYDDHEQGDAPDSKTIVVQITPVVRIIWYFDGVG